jgi:hypothetical protein
VKARQGAGGRRQEDYNPILKPDLVLLALANWAVPYKKNSKLPKIRTIPIKNKAIFFMIFSYGQ